MRKMEVIPYRNGWPIRFDEEAAQIRRIFADSLIEIHHIGSTSVPDLCAKPIIDIMPLVRRIGEVLDLITQCNNSDMKPWVNSGFRGDAISARVATTEPITFTYLKSATRILCGILNFGTISIPS